MYVLVVICNDCYPRQEEIGCKEWDNPRDSHAVSVQLTTHRTVCFLVSLAAEENGVTVPHRGVLLQVSVKHRQDKPSYLSDILVGHLPLLKHLLALMLSTLALPYYYSFREWKH